MFRRLRFAEFVALSLALHALIVLAMFLRKLEPKKPNELTVEILDQTPAPKIQATRPQEERKPKEKAEVRDRQIVEQEEKKTNEDAPDTPFLSAQNQHVQKQTVAKDKGEFRNSQKQAASPEATPSPKTWSLAPKLNAQDAIAEEGYKKAIQQEKKEEAEKTDTPDKKADQADGSQSQDYIKDVDQGLETLLNTREVKYYTYYMRIRRQLTQYWEPKVRTKLSAMFKQGRYIASDTDRVTKLIVVLDRSGNLVKVQIIKESGVTDLDDAATEAFQSAAPFPNPPAGIIDKDGTVKIRWDFVLES
jgi:protein TonB